jgi:hypothetical protein
LCWLGVPTKENLAPKALRPNQGIRY